MAVAPNPPEAKSPPPHDADDDELDDLPPFDGAEGEDDEEAAEELDDDGTAESDLDGLDDETGEGDPLDEAFLKSEMDELSINPAESGLLVDADANETLDIGGDDRVSEGESERDDLRDLDEAGAGEGDDFDLGGDESSAEIDSGEEGPDADDEELREEDLPRLDSGGDGDDEEGESEHDGMRDLASLDDGDDALPPWDDAAWERMPVGVDVGAARAVQCWNGGTIVGGAGAIAVDASGRSRVLGGIEGRVASVGARGTVRAVATERGDLFVSMDGGEQFRPSNGWRDHVSARDAEARIDVAVYARGLVVRTASGAIVMSDAHATSWSAPIAGEFAAFAMDSAGEIALVGTARTDDAAPKRVVLTTTRGDAIASVTVPLLDRVADGGLSRAAVAARNGAFAIAVPAFGVARKMRDGSWSRIEGTSRVTAITFIDDEATLLIALVADDESRAWLVRSTAASDRIVAQIGGDPDDRSTRSLASSSDDEVAGADPRVLALAWDDPQSEAKLVGDFGLLVFRRPPKASTM